LAWRRHQSWSLATENLEDVRNLTGSQTPVAAAEMTGNTELTN